MEIPTIYLLYLAGAGFSLAGLGVLRQIIRGDYEQKDVDTALEHLDNFDAPDEQSSLIAGLLKKILGSEEESD